MMAEESSGAPLIGLDAIAIDTETTGLEAGKAWIVEIAGVRLVDGLDAAASLQRRVRPPVSIPAVATRVHGIDDAAVSCSPTFAEVWPDFSAFIGGSVIIGHTLGFDLAVIERELKRAEMAWTRPRTLDTRLLAEVAAPDLPDYSLDAVAAWLGIKPIHRHTAMGDAVTTAQVFEALLPLLRQRGIRTLADAERASRALTHVLTDQHHAGWVEPVRPPGRLSPSEQPPRI